MRLPPSVHVVLGPSRIAGAGIGLAGLGTIAVVFMLPVAGWLQALGMLAVLAWVAAVFRIVALRRGAFAITEVRLAPDLVLVVHMGDGRLVAGHVRSATYVGVWLTTHRVACGTARAGHARSASSPDMLPAEDFRGCA